MKGSLIEMMISQMVAAAVAEVGPITMENIAANSEALKALDQIDKTKVRGILVLVATERGEDVVALDTSMSGPPIVLQALLKAGELLMQQARMSELMRRGKLDPIDEMVLKELLGVDASKMSFKTEEDYQPPTDTKQ